MVQQVHPVTLAFVFRQQVFLSLRSTSESFRLWQLASCQFAIIKMRLVALLFVLSVFVLLQHALCISAQLDESEAKPFRCGFGKPRGHSFQQRSVASNPCGFHSCDDPAVRDKTNVTNLKWSMSQFPGSSVHQQSH
jgi:hypothetical protein